MNTSSKSNTLRFLSSIHTDHLQYDTKLGILFFHNQIYSYITEAVILFLEYFQLVAQIFLFNTALYPDSMSNQNSLLNLIIDASKLVHPGSFLRNYGVHTYNLVVSIVFGLLMMKYSLTVYICIVALTNRKKDGFLIGLWRWIFKLQGRVLYLLISSILIEAALAASNNRVKTFGLAEAAIIAICVILICIEYIFSLILHIRFCYVLPTKSILSAKDSILETSTLTQKFITEILHLCFSSVTGCGWIIGIINLLISLMRVAYFFKTLPLYKVNILLYQGVLISTVTIANLTCLIQIIANSTNKDNVDIDSVLISWILISLLAIKIVQGCLNYYIVSLVRSYKHISPKLLLHKVYALKQFIKLSSTVEFGNKVHWLVFVKTTVKSNAMRILNADSRLFIGDKEATESSIMKMSIEYLERLLEKFPDSDVIKLYIIYYYAKKLKNYGTALKMIHDLKKDSSKLLLLNASLMLYDLQNQIFANNNKLNVSEYTRNVSTVAQWKFYMLGQVDLQISLCEETMTEIPDLAKIFNLAQKMDHYRSAVEEKSDTVFKTIPGHYIEPYMIYAHYQLVVNHSVAEYREYVRYHSKKYKQYEKYFKNNDMMAENIYHNTGFMICSAQKANFGKILFCTKGIADIFGGDVRRYVGSDVNIFAAPATRPFYTLFYRNFVDSRTSNAETPVLRGFSIHKDGYIFELDFCLDVYLFESQGLCICGMGRKVMSNKDYLLVHENGEIEGISRKLGRKLGFFQNKESRLPKINISSLSQHLGRANQAFNIINLPEKYKPNETEEKHEVYEVHEDNAEDDNYFKQKYDINIEEATHLHTIFSSEGKEIVIKIPKKTANQDSFTQCYTYNCTIKTMNYGSLQLKTFTLEEIEVHIENMKSPPSLKHIEELNLEDDEKQDGWIDFNRLESECQQPRQISTGTDNRIFTSLRTQEEQLLSPSKNLLSERLPLFQNLSPMTTPTENQVDFFKRKRSLHEKSKSSDESDHEESELSESDIVKPQQSVTSQISQSSNSDATLKAYKTALLNSATSKTFKVLCFCFYSLLILLFTSQIQLKYSLSDFLTQLEIKKNILGDSSKRDTAVAGVHGNANALLLTYNTIIGGQNTTEWNDTLVLYDIGMQQQLTLVDTSNSALLVDMQHLNEQTGQLFFQQDVKVYDTYFNATQQMYMIENNFEAINSILQTGARALQKAILWDFTNLNDFFFLFRNCENDVLIKSIALGDILDQSLTDERVAAESLVITYLIVTLVLLGVIAVALYVLIWKQYLTERNNLLAFVKLDPQSIETVHSMLIEFKYKVENERSFEKTTIDLAEYIQPTIKGRNARGITVYKKHLQTANYRGILRKYLLHIVKLTVFILIFMGLVLWSNLSAKVSIQFFHTKQIQLRLAGQMKFRTTMTAIISDELLFRNNGSQVFNQWTANLAPSSLNDLVTLRNDLTAGLRNDNGQYDPVIADILFDSGRCDLLPADGQVFCQTLKANGILLNYMSVLVSWENLLRLRYEQYLALTNKTISVLIGIRTALGPMFRPLRSVLLYQSDAIYKVINEAFEANLNSVAKDRNTIFAIITVALIVLSIIAWFSLLRSLKEANSQFKKVLQSLPAHIVLQSFLLRLFLMGNSTTTLK